MWANNSGNSGETARRDAEEKRWKEQERAREEERKRQEKQQRLEERVRQYAAAMREQASWRGKHCQPK